uniref:Uncharacterized protein n=1 Tax=viral metagenome TaxID=1070528 RepID=A0A6C0CI69_9ZZZZ
MRKSPNPSAKALLSAYREMGQQDQSDFLRALEGDMFRLHVSDVCKTESDREILTDFAPEYRDVRETLLAPFHKVVQTVREAEKMAAYVIVTRPPASDFRLALFFAEDPNLYDTLFQQEYENDNADGRSQLKQSLHEFEFSKVIQLGGTPLETLRKIGLPVTSWVRYSEKGHSWSWDSF